MKILVVSATYKEINPFLQKYSFIKIASGLYETSIKENKYIVCITGIGIMPTIARISQLLRDSNYDLALNCGIAGSYDASLKLCDTVNVSSECLPEFGIETSEGIKEITEIINDFGTDTLILKGNIIKYIQGTLKSQVFKTLKNVKGATVNTVSTSISRISSIIRNYGAQIETMEGAAFFYACASSNIPAIQIRTISNVVGEKCRSKWKIDEAINELNNVLNQIINEI